MGNLRLPPTGMFAYNSLHEGKALENPLRGRCIPAKEGASAGHSAARLGVPRLQARLYDPRRHRQLRGAAGVLGCGRRHRLDLRTHQPLPRAPVPPPGPTGGAHRPGARVALRVLRPHGSAAAGPSGRSAAHHAGGRIPVPAPGQSAAAGRRRHGGGRGRLSRCRSGGGPQHRRAPGQAEAVRILGLPGGLGGGAGAPGAEPAPQPPAGAGHSLAGGRRL